MDKNDCDHDLSRSRAGRADIKDDQTIVACINRGAELRRVACRCHHRDAGLTTGATGAGDTDADSHR